MQLEELRRQIASGHIKIDQPATTIIEEGKLQRSSGDMVTYSIVLGWNIISSMECDKSWGRSNLELFEYIDQQNFSDAKLAEVLGSIQTEDHHWDWFAKSATILSDQYKWFYLYADNKPQGACVIYHPKDSAFGDSQIFYVEFVAVAPWNRKCLVRDRELLGVGSTLLRAALKYSVETLGLTPGFSLHSLPQACAWYKKIKMVNVQDRDKGALLYFEMPHTEAITLLGAA